MQTTLDEYIWLKPKCNICGRLFKSIRALNAHLTKAHHDQEPPIMYADEGMELVHKGCHVELKVRMRRTLWKDIEMRAREANMSLEQLVFQTLVNIASYGKEWYLWTERRTKKPTYVT